MSGSIGGGRVGRRHHGNQGGARERENFVAAGDMYQL
jgi:hypothetical protein